MTNSYKGEERRVSQDEQLGHIRGRVDSIQNELTESKQNFKEFKELIHTKLEQHFKEEREDREKIMEQLDVYRQVYLTLRGIGIGIVAVIAWKWNEFLEFLKHFIK